MIKYASYFGANSVLIVPGIVTEELSYEDVHNRAKEKI